MFTIFLKSLVGEKNKNKNKKTALVQKIIGWKNFFSEIEKKSQQGFRESVGLWQTNNFLNA